MADLYGYITPAKVKTLLVPINNCSQADFNRYYDIIRSNVTEIRLMDITPDNDLHYFNPQAFPNGRIFLDFHISGPDNDSIFLHDFEPFRKTFIILGVGKYSEDFNNEDTLHDLKKHFPASIVHNIILFDTPNDKVKQLNKSNSYTFYHNGILQQNITALETLMCDISKGFLRSLDTYASSYSNITLRSPVLITDSHLLTRTISHAQKRLSSGSTSFKVSFGGSSPTHTNGNGGSSAGSASSGGHSITSNSNGNLSPADAKSKTQQRHTGRQSKLMGSFYLLAGKYNDALNSFIDATINLRKCDDYLWLSNALEGLGITVLLLRFVGANYKIPNQILNNVLQLNKSKLSALSTEILSPKRNSSDSSVNGHSTAKATPYSPRNSSSSNINFSSSGPITDFTALSIPEFVGLISSKVLHFYQISTNDFENMVPDIVYVEAILRIIKFKIGVYLSGGYESKVTLLESLVKSTKVPSTASIIDTTYFSKSDILNTIDNIFKLQLIDMGIIEQCRVYCTLASMYTDLGMLRKRAFILRFLLVALLPKLEQNYNLVNNDELKDIRDEVHSIRDLFEYLFLIYGINLESESSAIDSSIHSEKSWLSLQIQVLRLCIQISEAMKDYKFFLQLGTLLLTRYSHCLPTDDQITLKEKIDSLIYLSNRNNLNLSSPYWDPFLVRRVQFVNNKNKDDIIPFSEYEKNTAQTVGLGDVNTNNGYEQTPEPFLFDPYNKVDNNATTINRDKLLLKDEVYQLKVLLQNPFAFEIELNDVSIVTEDDFKVQTFKHHIRSLRVINKMGASSGLLGRNVTQSINTTNSLKKTMSTSSTTSVGLPASIPTAPTLSSNASSNVAMSSLIVPPLSTEIFSIPFKPLQVGELTILGFNIQIGTCNPQLFKIIDGELFNETSFKVKSMGIGEVSFDKASHERSTLDAVIHNLETCNVNARTSIRELSLTVIPPQPSLSLTKSSVNNGWIMLLEGEIYKFSITLTNHSDVLINYLSFSFWDSTIEPLNKRLSTSVGNQTLPAAEIYEIEYNLLKVKPFKILNKEAISEEYKTIEPRKEITIDYEVMGKRGMKESKLILEYSHKQFDDVKNSFIKHINVPLNLTILSSIEILGCDIIPLFSSSLQGFKGEYINDGKEENLNEVLKFITSIIESPTEEIGDYCLFILDIRNFWNEKLKCQFNYQISKQKQFSITEIIEPSKTSRLLIPIKRIGNEIDLTRLIPSLRHKQFVKNYLISEADDLQMRELFWLRHYILENLHGTWETIESKKRMGLIELRTIRLTPKMANVLQFNKIRILTSIEDEFDNQPCHKESNQYLLKVDQFYSLKTVIINEGLVDIKGILRHLPISMNILSTTNNINVIKAQLSIDKKILINGVLQSTIPMVKAGETIELELTFLILERGEYEWGSVLDILNHKQGLQIVGREPIYITAS
ncbi:TRS120 targeting complex component [Scheffersomyces coipomensis]|uniref:TRS120 targeting complex component n=1 Tax=Scheffersomyces coipomensis TaxID=1788519 RepID=UPI00315DA340